MNSTNITPQEFALLFETLELSEFEQVLDEREPSFFTAVERHLEDDKIESYRDRLADVLRRKKEQERKLEVEISELQSRRTDDPCV